MDAKSHILSIPCLLMDQLSIIICLFFFFLAFAYTLVYFYSLL